MILNKLVDGTLTATSSQDQSGPGSNGYEGLLHTPKNWNIIIRCSLDQWFPTDLGPCPTLEFFKF